MHIALRINMDGQYLEVTSVCYGHYHPISQVGYLSTEEFQCKCMVLVMNEVASRLAFLYIANGEGLWLGKEYSILYANSCRPASHSL